MPEQRRAAFLAARLLLPVVAGLVLSGYSAPPTRLQQIVDSRELVVATRNSPTTYYEGAQGPSGFEYDLARLFADGLGVELRIVAPPSLTAIVLVSAIGIVAALAWFAVAEPRIFAYRGETTVAAERAGNLHVKDGVSEDQFVTMREARDRTLSAPTLLLPSIQVNMRAGKLPPPDANGVSYIRVPVTLTAPS